MRIVIECREAIVGSTENPLGADLYDFVVETESHSSLKSIADRVSAEAVKALIEGVKNVGRGK